MLHHSILSVEGAGNPTANGLYSCCGMGFSGGPGAWQPKWQHTAQAGWTLELIHQGCFGIYSGECCYYQSPGTNEDTPPTAGWKSCEQFYREAKAPAPTVTDVTEAVKAKEKRKADCTDSMERMWKQRRFTDATILTKEGSIPVHRAVMCSSSVFEAAFGGAFQEGSSCQIKIDDVAHKAVEAFVQYMYTREFHEETCCIELLPLAHRYEQSDLVAACAQHIVGAAEPSNICETLNSLKLFKDCPCVKKAWDELSVKVKTSDALRDALMMGV